ncbi:MAG: hypothetical protein LC775_13085, partial [Acidobacteria bacterium]|nr:hypothetical protein [Acidobacteriota bacterium]
MVEGKVINDLKRWHLRARSGVDVSRPRVHIDDGPVEANTWYEVIGYELDAQRQPVVRLARDWRVAGADGDPAKHDDVFAGKVIDVSVGGVVRDHQDELRIFNRTDGGGRFILREASPNAKRQEERGEIAVSLSRSYKGLLANLIEGQDFTATVVPARAKGCFTITLLELLHQHIKKANTLQLLPDHKGSRRRRAAYYPAVVHTPPNEAGWLQFRLLHQDSSRGIEHIFEFKPDADLILLEDSVVDETSEGVVAPSSGQFSEGKPVSIRLEYT